MDCITKEQGYRIARGFMSEDAENGEYDRALIEFLADAFEVQAGEDFENACRRAERSLRHEGS